MATLRSAARTPNALARQIDAFVREVPGMVRRVLRSGAARYRREYTAARLSGRPGLIPRSGGMRRSFQVNVEELATTYRLTAKIGGRGQRGTRVHEEGRTIRPKRARMLSIPLPPVKTAQGLARFRSPRQQPGLFMIKSKRGNLLLVKRVGDKIEPQWVLKHSVTIPARLYFKSHFARHANRIRIDLKNEYRRVCQKPVRRI